VSFGRLWDAATRNGAVMASSEASDRTSINRPTKFQRLSPEQTGTKGNPSTDGGCHMDSSVKTTGSLPSMPVPQFRGGRALI
jgi:hypothetical protein